MGEPVTFQKETRKLRGGTDESKSRWVPFPDQRLYLLPVLSRQQKLVPVFDDDGTVTLQVEEPNPELSALAQKVMGAVASQPSVSVGVGSNGALTFTPQVYADFISLVRGLLLANYDYTKDDLRAALTVTHQQFGLLVSQIILHLNGG